MIQANELRIGNLVLNKDQKPIKVNTILFSGINHWQDMGASGMDSCFDLNPIPLTEDILVKCGFNDTIYEWTKGSIVVKWSSRIVSSGLRQGLYVEGLDHIQYLHQLQNLYYALTQTELNYKP